jgi:hypothetical protein
MAWTAPRDLARFGIWEGDRITFAEGHTLLIRSLDAQATAAVMAEIRGQAVPPVAAGPRPRSDKVSRALDLGAMFAGLNSGTPEGDQ